MPDLGDYLAEVAGRPWHWGQPMDDCCEFAATWFKLCGHPDPMTRWRGRYKCPRSAQRVINSMGGLVNIWKCTLGPPIEGEPHVGDIGVLSMGDHEAGAIYTGPRWAIRSDRGWVSSLIDPAAIKGIWRSIPG